jgi:glycosyltransferase involved in cell wall biosynthesis
MKLGIYLETHFLYSGKLYCEDVYTFNLNEQAVGFEYLFLGRISKKSNTKAMFPVKRYAGFFEIDYYSDLPSLLKKFPFYVLKNRKTIEDFVLASDMLLIMTPSPVSILVLNYAIKHNKEYCLLIRQDSRTMIPARYKGFKQIVATILANYLESIIEKNAERNNSRVLALGPDIYSRYSKLSDRVFLFASSRYKTNDVIDYESVRSIDFGSTIKILYVGRIEINKGLHELLSAVKEFEDCELTLVGDGQYMPVVQNEISRLNLQTKVKTMGYIPFSPDLFGVYRSHDILILPSYSEGLPQVILEAMANGCLVLASNVGSIPHIVKHGKNGFLFQPKSTSSIVELLQSLKHDPFNFHEIQNNALQTAKDYSFESQSKILIEALDP